MEEKQKDQEGSSTIEGKTGNLPQELPVYSPDVVSSEKLYIPVDNKTSVELLESHTQYPEKLTKENTFVKSSEKLQITESINQDHASALEKLLNDVTKIENEDREVFAQNKLLCSKEKIIPDPAEETAVIALTSLTQDLPIPDADNHMEDCEGSKEMNDTRCDLDRDQNKQETADIVASNRSLIRDQTDTDKVLKSTIPKDTRELNDYKNSTKILKTIIRPVSPIRSRSQMGFFCVEIVDHVEVIFSGDLSSNLGRGSAGSAGEASSRRRGPGGSLWRVFLDRFCHGFRISSKFCTVMSVRGCPAYTVARRHTD